MKEYLTALIDFHDSYFKKLPHDHALSMIQKSQQIQILLTHINEPTNLKIDEKFGEIIVCVSACVYLIDVEEQGESFHIINIAWFAIKTYQKFCGCKI